MIISHLITVNRFKESFHISLFLFPRSPPQVSSHFLKRRNISPILKGRREPLLLLNQQVGHVHRSCPRPRDEVIFSNNEEHLCWIISGDINTSCNVNGPSPVLVQPWMHPLLHDTSMLLYFSSHVENLHGEHLKLLGMSKDGGEWAAFSENVILPSEEKMPCRSFHSPSIHVDAPRRKLIM